MDGVTADRQLGHTLACLILWYFMINISRQVRARTPIKPLGNTRGDKYRLFQERAIHPIEPFNVTR